MYNEFNYIFNEFKTYTLYSIYYKMARPTQGISTDKKKAYASIYYEKKKQEYGEKVFCECGCLVRRMGLIQHRRAGIHTYRIRMIEEKKTEDENTENE